MSSATAAIGRRADIALSDASRMANEAYFEVFYASEPAEAETIAVSSTTSGENKIELPSDFLEPISATIIWRSSWGTSGTSSYQTLAITSIEEMDAGALPVSTPEKISYFNSWLELYPSPDSGYSFQLRYRAHPVDLLSTSSVPSVSTEWRKAVELKSRELYAAYVGDYEREQKASVDYARYVVTLKTDVAKRQAGEFDFRFAPRQGSRGRRRV